MIQVLYIRFIFKIEKFNFPKQCPSNFFVSDKNLLRFFKFDKKKCIGLSECLQKVENMLYGCKNGNGLLCMLVWIENKNIKVKMNGKLILIICFAQIKIHQV